MRAYEHTITATADPKPFGGSITAALASDVVRPVSRLLASTGIEDAIRRDGKISIATVDRLLDAASVPMTRRIELKAAMSRAGLLP